MGSKKISQLPSIVTPSLSGITVVVDSGTTYNITLDDLKTVLKDEISEGSSGTSGTSGSSGSAGTSGTSGTSGSAGTSGTSGSSGSSGTSGTSGTSGSAGTSGTSGTSVGSVKEITYEGLTDLIDANLLSVGNKYLITDYQTVHEIPNSGTWDEQGQIMSSNAINTGQVEPLLVTALTTNRLMNECYSTLFPQDIIYYDIQNNQTMVQGCTKGYIYRRIDTLKQNDIGFDYRNVKFRRYQMNVTTEHATGNTNYTKGAVVKKTGTVEVYIKLSDADGLFSDDSKWKRFEWDNLMYISPIGFNQNYAEFSWLLIDSIFQLKIPTTANFKDYYFFSTAPTITGVQSTFDNIYQNKFKLNNSSLIFNSNSVFFGNNFSSNAVGDNFSSNTVGDYFSSNTVGDNFNRNTVGDNFNRNTVGNYFSSNTVRDNFNSNTVRDNFQSNTVGNSFSSNTVGNYFSSNTVRDNFYSNTVGNGFNGNTVGNGFYSNAVGNGFQYNTVGNGFYSNAVGNGFQSNTVGNNFSKNTVRDSFYSNTVGNYFNSVGGIDFSLATYVYQSYNKELFTNSVGGKYLKYYDGSNILQTVAANA